MDPEEMRSMARRGAYHRDQQKITAGAVQGLCQERQVRMLLIDDDALVAAMSQAMLVCLGVDVVVHTCSLKALQAFQEAPHGFDLVITDLDMPGMTGPALACQLWQIRPDMAIVLCTGSVTMTWEKAQRLGFGCLLKKPFGLSDLAIAIEQSVPRRTVWVS
jgi:CheY-like chemotaxis protein